MSDGGAASAPGTASLERFFESLGDSPYRGDHLRVVRAVADTFPHRWLRRTRVIFWQPPPTWVRLREVDGRPEVRTERATPYQLGDYTAYDEGRGWWPWKAAFHERLDDRCVALVMGAFMSNHGRVRRTFGYLATLVNPRTRARMRRSDRNLFVYVSHENGSHAKDLSLPLVARGWLLRRVRITDEALAYLAGLE
ncbi:hypothetical protein ABIA32_003929 [Streptacidiphilus sp. MAP12-20]|uniref:hypothetical protein n=1 Tax=Streptacidiphilus sp. MAP12-20 TaxID=3156299 RepID=UPI00351472A4